MASSAYSEQVETNLHEGGSRGEINALYSRSKDVRTVFTAHTPDSPEASRSPRLTWAKTRRKSSMTASSFVSMMERRTLKTQSQFVRREANSGRLNRKASRRSL